ncbi:MAG: D-alanine--D-alanine ligase [Kiritimatiellae bacterium]|nr:D-alanine--D-alanine ligase [Kiritimatiellia bacterium]MDD5519361.1 D-alanine--D-alanine ligase [Kiritimatiellia bacterium]
MTLQIGLVYDLRKEYRTAGFSEEQSAEFDSEETIDALDTTLRSIGYDVQRIGNARALCSRLVAGDRWDLVFNIAEGVSGRSREAQVPCILETYGIPYTFSDPLVSAITMDKAMAKRLVREAGLNTSDFLVVRQLQDLGNCRMKFPLFAKPVAEGTGKGINQYSRIESMEQLESTCRDLLEFFKQPVLVEEFLPGREFTVGIIGTAEKAHVMGTMEVEVLPMAGGNIYSFETKERCDELVRYTPLKDMVFRREIEDLALDAYLALECRDAARTDIRVDSSGSPSFMEINALPGLHPTHSDLPMIATQEGVSYTDLISTIISSALRRLSK